jgi:hypothetical protein
VKIAKMSNTADWTADCQLPTPQATGHRVVPTTQPSVHWQSKKQEEERRRKKRLGGLLRLAIDATNDNDKRQRQRPTPTQRMLGLFNI